MNSDQPPPPERLFSFFIETENDADIEDLTTLKVPTLTAQAALGKYNNFHNHVFILPCSAFIKILL